MTPVPETETAPWLRKPVPESVSVNAVPCFQTVCEIDAIAGSGAWITSPSRSDADAPPPSAGCE